MANTNRHSSNPLIASAAVADLLRDPLIHDFFAVLRRLLRARWAGNVPRALRVLQDQRRLVADPQTLHDLAA